jgi:hypothetical protein
MSFVSYLIEPHQASAGARGARRENCDFSSIFGARAGLAQELTAVCVVAAEKEHGADGAGQNFRVRRLSLGHRRNDSRALSKSSRKQYIAVVREYILSPFLSIFCVATKSLGKDSLISKNEVITHNLG